MAALTFIFFRGLAAVTFHFRFRFGLGRVWEYWAGTNGTVLLNANGVRPISDQKSETRFQQPSIPLKQTKHTFSLLKKQTFNSAYVYLFIFLEQLVKAHIESIRNGGVLSRVRFQQPSIRELLCPAFSGSEQRFAHVESELGRPEYGYVFSFFIFSVFLLFCFERN
jgi:hypothetical protein